MKKNATDSACGEAISVFILLASFQKSTLCTSKSQTDPIDLFCAISAKHMQEFQLCHISQLEPGHDSVASRLHMIPVKHTAAFTHRRFYIQTLLYRITFTQTDFYTQAPLLKDALHTNSFTKKPFHTLEKNWIIRVIRRELNPITCSSTRLYYIYIIIIIYGTMLATSCDLNAPRCTTKVPQVRFHGSRGSGFVGHRPPRDPGDPLL